MPDDAQTPPVEIQITEPLCAVFRRRLKAAGQKYTPERARILDAILAIDDIFEADQLQEAMREGDFPVSKATIYRTLKLLLQTGIVQEAPINSEQTHYQLSYGRRPRDLLIRVDTNEIIPIDVPELRDIRDELCARLGLTAQGHRLQIYAQAKSD